MKLSVVIPTYRRPADLDRCLRGLELQQRRADEVIVVVRLEDQASMDVLAEWQDRLPLGVCRIDIPGVVQALNRARQQVTGDILTITDDDTCATPDWLQRIERHFEENPRLGGLGGRDILREAGEILLTNDAPVGVILPYGRLMGNHHSGQGPAREVDHLKGVNMSWRLAAIEGLPFPTDLRGKGAQVYFELAFSLAVQRRGWLLVYDPAIQVHHYVAQRFDNDNRALRDMEALGNSAYNLYVALRCYMRPGLRRNMALIWVHYLGAFGHPGVVRGWQYRLRADKPGIALRRVTAQAWKDAKTAPCRKQKS